MKVELQEYRGIPFIYADYRGALTQEEMLAGLDTGFELNRLHPEVTRLLGNFTGTRLSPEFTERVKATGKTRGLKTALVGITGIQRILVNALSAVTKFDTKTFDDEAAAKEWLVT